MTLWANNVYIDLYKTLLACKFLRKTKKASCFFNLAMRPCFIFINHGSPFLSDTNFVLRLLARFNIFSLI
jgi:hypothetical protein